MSCNPFSAPKPPAAPDPNAIISAQRFNQTTPFGSQTWTPPSEAGGQWSVSSQLSPAQQQQLGSLESLNQYGTGLAADRLQSLPRTGTTTGASGVPQWMQQQSYGGVGASGGFGNPGGGANPYAGAQPLSGLNTLKTSLDLGSLPTVPADREASSATVRDSLFGARRALLDPEFQRQDRRFTQDMANAGLPLGSEAWGEAMGTVKDRQNFALSQAAADAVQAGGAEDSRLFGQQMALRGQGVAERAQDANVGLGARKQYGDEALGLAGLQAGRDIAGINADTSLGVAGIGRGGADYRANLDYMLGSRGQDIGENNQNWQQGMQAWQMARGGLMQPNFQNSQGDPTGAYQIAQNAANANYAGKQAGYGANMNALGTLGSAAAKYLPWAAMFPSSITFKERLAAADHGTTLAKLSSVPVYTYHYKPDVREALGISGHKRIGPMAEDFQAVFGGESTRTIDVQDAVGVLFSAVKGLQQELLQLRADLTGGR